jgi:hypothetical protein
MTIDKTIKAEHYLIEPSDLGKSFSNPDSEMNCNLSPDLRPKLDEIILENRLVLAKPDVGKFKGFTMKVDIDENVPPEQ